MRNQISRSLLLLALLFLQACGSSSQTADTESAGSGDMPGVAATGQEILDRSRLSIINTVFPSLPSDASALKAILEPIAPCSAASNTESCDGGGQVTTSPDSCMEFENRVREWSGSVTFTTCGLLPIDGQIAFILTLGPIPESCSETFCPWSVPLRLVLAPDGPLTAGGEPVSLAAFYEGNSPDLLLTELQLQIGVHSCRLESGMDSTIVCGNDIDGDGVPDDLDSCPAKFNPSQADTDGDGLGDRCDDNVTGESSEELACTAKVDVQACLDATDGDCCEGQFCGSQGVCQTCSELFGFIGLACRPGHPNDCCSGQFCTEGGQCELCPQGGGILCVATNDTGGPLDEENLHAPCLTDNECQQRAATGEFDADLRSIGFNPTAPSTYSCLPTGGPLNGCCTEITEENIIPACQNLPPPPDEACAGAVLECTGAAGYVGTTDLDAACDAIAKDFSDPAASGSCGGTCCAISCGGTEADCSSTGTDYCLSTYGSGSECVDGCCIHSPGGGGGGGCTGLSNCSQYGPNADAYCDDVAGNGYICVDDCCLQGPLETNCHDGVDDEPDGSIDCADSDCSYTPDCYEFVCDDALDNDNDTFADCDDLDCSNYPACITCPSGVNAALEDCNTLGGCSGSQYCNYDGCCHDITCGDFICSSGEEDGCADCPESDCADNADNNNDGLTDCDDYTCLQDIACGTNYCPTNCATIGGVCDNGLTAFGFPFFGGNTFCSTPVNTPCPSLAGAPAGFYCGTVNLGDGTTPDQICQATGAPGTLSCVSGCCAEAP